MFFLATFQLVETITIAIFGNSFANWHQHINSGSLDLILTKPIDTQLLLSLHAVSIPQLLTILAPIALLIQLTWQYRIFPSVMIVGEYILALSLAISIFYSVWLILMTFLFWFIGIPQWHHLFYRITTFMQVPPIVYQGVIKFIFYFVIPVFAAIMLPLQVVWQQSHRALGLLILVAVIMFGISRIFFKVGLRSYNSASS
jgi:ABC-2 type transport system permease protein